MTQPVHPLPTPRRAALLAGGLLTGALLSACGSSSDTTQESIAPAAVLATASTTLQLEVPDLPQSAGAMLALPMYDVAPALLAEPDDRDVDGYAASASRTPQATALAANMAGVSTRRLTVQAIREARQQRTMNALRTQVEDTGDSASADAATPLATSSVIATYTPAQIRAAYNLSALPATGATLTAAQRAQLGAGQTIYIVDAMHDPNVASELAAFNSKFGLPVCTVKAIAATGSLPLAAANASACELSIVYTTAAGAMTATAPAYNASWATEITLDVQWAHATAPLARIVLIEAPDASLNSLLGAVKLANAMGPGVVSMSFGGAEGSWTSSVDAAFAASGMTYLAATGDSGAGVSWPSVSPNVVAVGGTTLTYSGSGTRSETGWSGTGGGTSAYSATPSYQNSSVPGMGTPVRRNVADVAFNADPSSGQYVAVIASGSSTVSWLSVGGTSLATPQWAGLMAVANATRVLSGKAVLSGPHAALYGQIASVPGYYASVFADITKGSNGTCAACSAKTGYDVLAGLGTPNATSLISTLSGTTATASAPKVAAASISGKVGTALTFTVAATSDNPLTYTLTGAPSGMVISSAGVVTWATPLAGTYSVTVTAKDSKTGLTGQGVYTVSVAALPAPVAPVVTAATISGKPGAALTFGVTVAAPNPVTYALTGAPAGMSINSAGTISWANPQLGTYSVTVVAKDSKTGLSGQAVMTVKIATVGPVITAAAMTGVVGKSLSGTISFTTSGATGLSVTISGAPLGMGFSMSGMSITALWPSPKAGSYTLTVVATDSAGLSAKLLVPVTVAAK